MCPKLTKETILRTDGSHSNGAFLFPLPRHMRNLQTDEGFVTFALPAPPVSCGFSSLNEWISNVEVTGIFDRPMERDIWEWEDSQHPLNSNDNKQ